MTAALPTHAPVCMRGADGRPSGLLKGALTFPGKDERHFHFTAFRSDSAAPRINSAYTDAQLVGAVCSVST